MMTDQEVKGLLASLRTDVSASTWGFGSTTGHLGAGDQAAGLDHLLRSGAAKPGQRVLLIGSATGFACTVAQCYGLWPGRKAKWRIKHRSVDFNLTS